MSSEFFLDSDDEISQDETMIDEPQEQNNTIHHHACYGGHREIVLWLIQRAQELSNKMDIDNDEE